MYLNHYVMLVWAMFTLLGEEIDQGGVDKSQTLLDDFAQSLPTMYCKYSNNWLLHDVVTVKPHQTIKRFPLSSMSTLSMHKKIPFLRVHVLK